MLWVDEWEPKEAVMLLSQSVEAVRAPLNSQGFADYMWLDVLGNRRQWERKQLIEYMSDMDGVEEQLNRELRSCDELVLVVEGVGEPDPTGVQQFRRVESKGKVVYIPGYHYPDRKPGKDGRVAKPRPDLWPGFLGRKYGLKAKGVDVVVTWSYHHTLDEIAAAYHASMKVKHTTFDRYIIPHVSPFSPDPHVDNLARLQGTGIGVERAKMGIEVYRTFWGVVSAPRMELEELWGKAVTKQFLERIGRVDVLW